LSLSHNTTHLFSLVTFFDFNIFEHQNTHDVCRKKNNKKISYREQNFIAMHFIHFGALSRREFDRMGLAQLTASVFNQLLFQQSC